MASPIVIFLVFAPFVASHEVFVIFVPFVAKPLGSS
jgi:hypothetical protein